MELIFLFITDLTFWKEKLKAGISLKLAPFYLRKTFGELEESLEKIVSLLGRIVE